MITLEDARERVGDGVVYRAHPGADAEDGIVTAVGERYVRVRYGGDSTSKATRPEDLEWLSP